MDTVSVVIPTKNAGGEFRETVRAIREQTVAGIELIVIDSGSTDGTVAIAEEWADRLIEIPPEEFHHARTRNRAASHATGDIVVFTVQDALPVTDEWLAELSRPIRNDEAAVTYGNQIAYPDAKPPDEFFYDYFYPNESVTLTEADTDDEAAFYMENIFLSNANAAVARQVWEEFQFRDSVGMSEDKEFAYRVASAGYPISYCPDAMVYHSHDYDLPSLFRRRYKDGRAYTEIAGGDSDAFLADGLEYVRNEYAYLLDAGALSWIPYALVYDLIYFVSFTLGKQHDSLPAGIDQRLRA